MTKLQAIIFDCFGVLTTDGWLAFRNTHFEPGSDVFKQARALNVRVDSGLIDYPTFIQGVAELAGVSFDEVKRQIESNIANERLFTYIRDMLKPHYKLGMLSNAGANWLDDLFEPWQVGLFDEIVLSYETGIAKPDIRAYEVAAARLGFLPEECLFIDDQPLYVTSARESGMQGIIFTDTDEAIRTINGALS